MEVKDAVQLNPLSLAFLGDAVFTLFVREKLLLNHDGKSGYLHKIASSFVCASAQAEMLDAITDELTAEEREIARRSRNCHNTSKAKNAALGVYKKATALEGVLGFLKITGQTDRLNYLMEKCVSVKENQGGEK